MSPKTVSYKKYVAGWLDSTIHDFLPSLQPCGESTKYALITCIDSNPNPNALRWKSPELKPLARRIEVVGTGLLLPTELLVEADSETQIFFGFDEVWFFPQRSITPKPLAGSIMGPPRLDQHRLKELGNWMAGNKCSLGLGDGDGLNLVTKALGLVGIVLGHSIEQPEPTAASA